mgnify:FL=1|tara:strand:+ start:600 stop:1964 length:1365 start_codon:yes stop_codon:yes gene_type:complete
MQSIFIFRRDYRLIDNTSLIECCKISENVNLLFIFTPEQITNKNEYKSNNAAQILVESLFELKEEIEKNNGKFNICYGDNIKVLEDIIKNNKIDAIYLNKDYTPYSKKRDMDIEKLCNSKNISYNAYDDLLLYPIDKIKSKTGNPYSKFSFYYKEAIKLKIEKPQKVKKYNFNSKYLDTKYKINKTKMESFYDKNDNLYIEAGRSNALKILNGIQKLKDYNKDRDLPKVGNSYLSSHIRFGNVSIRECYWKFVDKLGKKNQIIDQLYWNCFYTELGNNFPDMYKKRYLVPKFKDIKWDKSTKLFNAWKEGKTGFPLSDAGMREMNTTGFMHNRVRMTSATLLSRVLLLDWRMGEKYFSQTLVDHLRSNNEGNWFWVVGTANHSQVYFRIMSEWSQIKRFDPDCEYVKKWIPELEEVPAKDILKWNEKHESYDIDYPAPIVDDKVNKKESIERYK